MCFESPPEQEDLVLEEESVDKSHPSAQREVGEGRAVLKYMEQETPKCFVHARRCAVLGNSLQGA